MKTKLIYLVIIFILSINAFAKTIKIACVSEEWYPFIFTENAKLKGMHVDIVEDALRDLEYEAEFIYYPMRRSINSAERGDVDAVLSIPYSDKYSGLNFPKDSKTSGESDYRIMHLDLVLLTSKTGNYKYKGDIKTVPQPVRILLGMDELKSELEKNGIRAETVNNEEQNFKKIIRDRNGSIITTTVVAESMIEKPIYGDELMIQALPLKSESYHLVFSKNSKNLTDVEKEKIWDEIKKLREDYVYMLQIFAQY